MNALPQVNFSDYLSTFTPCTFPERVIVTYPEYPHSLSKILKETPSNVVESYLITRAALSLAPNLGLKTEAWKAERSLQETLTGIKKGAVADRSETCVARTESALGFAVGRYFVNETFGGDSKKKGTKVISGECIWFVFTCFDIQDKRFTDIVDVFKVSLGNIEWMDHKSAVAAAEKVSDPDSKYFFSLRLFIAEHRPMPFVSKSDSHYRPTLTTPAR